MKRATRAVVLLVALCACIGGMASGAGAATKEKAAVTGKPGARDMSFGKGGKVTVVFPAEAAGSSGP